MSGNDVATLLLGSDEERKSLLIGSRGDDAGEDDSGEVVKPSFEEQEDGLLAGSPPSSSSSRGSSKRLLNPLMNEIGNSTYQGFIGGLTGMAELTDGLVQLSASFLIHYLGDLFHLSNQRKALVGTCSGAGMLLGATSFGRISDLWGRKYAFVMSLIIAGGFGLMSASSPTYDTFLVFRFLLSIGIGGNVPLAFTVFTEFSAKENRGGYLTLLEAFWSLGAVLSCAIAWIILPHHSWQLYVVAVSLPGLVLGLACIYYLPETPRFLLISGDMAGAEELVGTIARENRKPHLADVTLEPSEATFEESSFGSLFSPAMRQTTVMLFFLYFLLAYGCGVFVWMPVLLQEKKLAVMSMYRSMVIMASAQLPGVVFAAYLVETTGRKNALYIFFFMGAMTTLLFAVSKSEYVVVVSTVFMEFFLAGTNGALAAVTVELFPTTLRSSAMGACSSLSRVGAILNPIIWAALLDIGVPTAIFTGAIALFVALLAVAFLPETRDSDLSDHAKTE